MGKELELAIKIGGKIDKSLGSAINAAQSQLNTINKSLNGAGMAIAAGVATVTTKLVVDSVNTYKDYQSALNSAAATAGVERGTARMRKGWSRTTIVAIFISRASTLCPRNSGVRPTIRPLMKTAMMRNAK